MGIEVIEVSLKGEHIDLCELMKILYDKQIDSILLEGGATLNFSALQARIVNHFYGYIGMKIFGGKAAITPVGGAGVSEVSEAFNIVNSSITTFDRDYMIEGDIVY